MWELCATVLRVWRSFLAELDAKGRLAREDVCIDAKFPPAKQVGQQSAIRNIAW